MSRSNPTLTNPATRFFEWSGSKGQLEFYDKEKQERINVPLPFEFMPLDELSTIVGYSKRDESGYWSNEVRSIKNDILTVRTKHGVAQEGTYDTLADVRAKGAKYAKSIYIAYKTKQGWEIGNIKAHGSCLSAWIEFSGTCKPENGKVVIAKGEAQDAPTGEFYPPAFKYLSCTPEEDGIAIALDKQLQTYLNQYIAAAEFNRGQEDEVMEVDEAQEVVIEEIDEPNTVEATKERTRQAASHWSNEPKITKQADKQEDEEIKDLVNQLEGEPINLDDIPF